MKVRLLVDRFRKEAAYRLSGAPKARTIHSIS
jgi:hypothetical protein